MIKSRRPCISYYDANFETHGDSEKNGVVQVYCGLFSLILSNKCPFDPESINLIDRTYVNANSEGRESNGKSWMRCRLPPAAITPLKYMCHHQISIQGDHSACSKPPVDIDLKVLFWYKVPILKRNIQINFNGRFRTT